MTIDEALAKAARVLESAEEAATVPAKAEALHKVASSWLEMASLLLAREQHV